MTANDVAAQSTSFLELTRDGAVSEGMPIGQWRQK